MIKKYIAILLLCLTAGFSSAFAAQTLVVGASPVPHAEILTFLKPILAKQGVNLRIVVFTDYVQPNQQLFAKKLDANFFQHAPFLNDFNAKHHSNLVPIAKVHIEPFGIYSSKYRSIKELPHGATVVIPNDPSNGGRALLLLHHHGLLKLKKPNNLFSTTKDIISNPKNLRVKELDAAVLPRLLGQVDLACINTNFALLAKLSPKNALILEDSRSAYANVLAARKDNQKSASIQKLAKAINSATLKNFILKRYQNALVVIF
ncbi:MAG: methionine ABC transporter substrate-binding protein [Neisseriales bacterium]|nr:MAG: methionine ABC transporter substrate-binding protein [Neisseriales bacterium]